jgi:hypothetical protein
MRLVEGNGAERERCLLLLMTCVSGLVPRQPQQLQKIPISNDKYKQEERKDEEMDLALSRQQTA